MGFRMDLGMPKDKKVAVYSGHLYKDRGVHYAIEAMQELPEWELWCVGGWDEDVEQHKKVADQTTVLHFFPAFIRRTAFTLRPTFKNLSK